jgi:hypothetical protein
MTFTPASIASLSPMSLTASGGSGGVTILATELVNVSFGIFQTIHHHSGNVYPTLVVVPGAERRMRVQSPFAGAFALLGLALTPISALKVCLAKFADYNRLSTASHQQISLTSGCSAAAQISGCSVNIDGILMADIDIIFLSTDGATDPITITDNQSLPAITGTPTLHQVGPSTFGATNTIIPGVVAAGLAMGAVPTILRTDGDFFARSAARLQATPIITLTHSDPAALIDSITQTGTYMVDEVLVYFKEYDVATGLCNQSNGISFTIAYGRVHPHGPDESSNVVATTMVDIIGVSPDGNATSPISVSTGVDVPTPP